jgi:hypothetical protein
LDKFLMDGIYRLAITNFGDSDIERELDAALYLESVCRGRWLSPLRWTFEAEPNGVTDTMPVLVDTIGRMALETPETGPSRVQAEAIPTPRQLRLWRQLAFQQARVFPQPNGDHLPWERVQFEVVGGMEAARAAVRAVAQHPWNVVDGIATVHPADAAKLMQSPSPSLRYSGRQQQPPKATGAEWLSFDSIDDLIAAIKRASA